MAASPLRSITLTIRAPLLFSDLPGLYDRTCALLAGVGAGVLCCEVAGLAADAVAVDALARLALAARRRGCQVRLIGASPELLALVDFIGVADVLGEGR
jgi:ABC-type transporter Mla MlaB component